MKVVAAVVISADEAGVQPEGLQGLGWAVRDAGGGAQRAAQLAHDAGGLEPVADDIADGDRDTVAGQIDQVVPVAAHVQRVGGRPVAHGRPVVPDGTGSGQQGLLQGQGDLALAGVCLAQAFVDLLQFTGAGVELGLQHTGPAAVGRAAAGPDEFRDLLHPVHDQRDLPVGAEDGCVDRAPVVLLPMAGSLGILDVVAEQRHGVALAGGHHAQHRRLGLPHAGRGRVVRVLGEGVEDVAAQQLPTGAPGQPREVHVDVGVHQVRREQRHHAGEGLEDSRVVDLRFSHVLPASAPTVGVCSTIGANAPRGLATAASGAWRRPERSDCVRATTHRNR
jgi:hypothetical protein